MKPLGLAVLLVLALTASVLLADPPAPRVDVVVTIGLVDGEITATPDPAVARHGEAVSFVADPASAIETFNIQFHSPVPFGQGASVGGLNGAKGQAAQGVVQAGAEVGRRYKYDIRVWNGQRMIVRDPEIEIGTGERLR